MAHYLKWSRQGKNGVMALKIVMAKAYDRIEWKFLEDVMLKLEFHDVGVSLLEKFFTKIKSRSDSPDDTIDGIANCISFLTIVRYVFR